MAERATQRSASDTPPAISAYMAELGQKSAQARRAKAVRNAVDRQIDELVAAAPPLTTEQKARLRNLLRTSRTVATAAAKRAGGRG